MPLLRKVRVLAAKIESTSGTAESLSGSDAAFNAFDVECKASIEARTREGQGAFSRLPSTLGPYGGTISFKTELYSDTTSPAWATTLLPACGFGEASTVWTPKSEPPGSTVKTVTIAVYENGRLRRLRGAAGTFKIVLKTGEVGMVEWTFTGVWMPPSDASILTPTYPTVSPLRFANSGLAIGSYSPKISELTIDVGNSVVLREDSYATDGSGYFGALVTDREIKGSLDPEADLVATKNVYGEWLALTTAALTITLGSAGNQVVIAAPAIQWTNVDDGDRKGLQLDKIEFASVRSAAAGNDELSITFN